MARPRPVHRRHDASRHAARRAHLFLARCMAADPGNALAFPRQGHGRWAARPLHPRRDHPRHPIRLHTQEAERPGPRTKHYRRCLEHGDLRRADACRRHVWAAGENDQRRDVEKRLYHRMCAGACPHSRHQPFRRHHDGRALSELHALRCGPLFVSSRHPGHRCRYCAHPWRRHTKRMSHHLRRIAGCRVDLRRRNSRRSPS